MIEQNKKHYKHYPSKAHMKFIADKMQSFRNKDNQGRHQKENKPFVKRIHGKNSEKQSNKYWQNDQSESLLISSIKNNTPDNEQ